MKHPYLVSTHQGKPNHPVIEAKAFRYAEAGVEPKACHKDNKCNEYDIDNGQGRASSDRIHEVRSGPAGNDLCRWMHDATMGYPWLVVSCLLVLEVIRWLKSGRSFSVPKDQADI